MRSEMMTETTNSMVWTCDSGWHDRG